MALRDSTSNTSAHESRRSSIITLVGAVDAPVGERVYSPRRRQVNVDLIRAMLDAGDRSTFDAARGAAIAQFHPSLLAELDHLEHLPPDGRRAWAAECVDDLFDATLDANGALRGGWSPVADAATRARRVTEAVEAVCDWRALDIVITRDLTNELLTLLDEPGARPRAKAFERGTFARDGQEWPWQRSPLRRAADLDALRVWLEEQGASSRVAGLPELADAVGEWCAVLSPALLERAEWEGDRAVGRGQCGRCSMHFSSVAYLSIDPTCPWFERFGDGTIYIPTDFNLATCPFCAHEARVNAPMMFYSPARNQVIYNLPAPGATEEEAREFFREMIIEVREQYTSRLDAAAAAAFASAVELATYDLESFLHAVHYGETTYEEHVYLLTDFSGGEAMITDPAKKFFRGITPRERARFAALGRWPL